LGEAEWLPFRFSPPAREFDATGIQKLKTISTSHRLLGLLCSLLVLGCFLTAGCGSKKGTGTVQEKKTFIGAQSPNEVPEKYRNMQRP